MATHSELIIAKGKVMNDGLSVLDRYKLSKLTQETSCTDISIRFLTENIGIACALRASKGVSYQQEATMETVLRLLAVDTAYRVMHHVADSPVQKDALAELVKLAHLRAYGEETPENLEESLKKQYGTILRSNHYSDISATSAAQRCVFFSATQTFRDALVEAETVLGCHHQTVTATYFHEGRHGLLLAWKQGGPISFGAIFGVRSTHIQAVAETEIWHVAYAVANALIGLKASGELGISNSELGTFIDESLKDSAEAIANHVMRKGVEEVIKATIRSCNYNEAKSHAQNAVLDFSRQYDSVREVFERMVAGGVALTAANWDFEARDTFVIGDAMLYLCKSCFLEDYPLNKRASDIACRVVAAAMHDMNMPTLASRLAYSVASRLEFETQGTVLTRLLDEFTSGRD